MYFFKKYQKTKKLEYKKAKETKEEKIISQENRLKKYSCCCPGEEFFRHPHFRKQEYLFLASCKYFQGYLRIFEDIDGYSSTLTGVQLGGKGGRPPPSPAFF